MQVLVVSHKGIPSSPARGVTFGPEGGSIGRADSSSLVLDDPERTVSRVHAQILCRDGQYFVIDRGSNPLACNGRPLGAGNEAALSNGDRLTIGSFELLIQGIGAAAPAQAHGMLPAEALSTQSMDDPFADLLVGLEPIKPAPPVPAQAAAPLPNMSPLLDNPLGPQGASTGAVDPFADLLGPSSAAAAGGASRPLNDFSIWAYPPEDLRPVSISCSDLGRLARASIRWPSRRWPIRCCNPIRPIPPTPWSHCKARPGPPRRPAVTTWPP